jgi:hypothetical protein
VTEDETRQFAQKLSEALQAKDLVRIDKLIHLNELIERSVSDLGLSPDKRREFLRSVHHPIGQSGFGRMLLRDGASYKFLRIHTVAGRQRALFRSLHPEGGLNYYDFTLARFPDGVGMEDVYIFLTSEPLSQTLRHTMIPVLAQSEWGVRVQAQDHDYVKSLPKLSALLQSLAQGQTAQAVANYRELPRQLRESKAVLVKYVEGMSHHGGPAEKEYLAAVEKFRELYPADPAADLISVDYFVVKKQYDKALAAVSRLEKTVGGDPYLWALRGSVLLEAKRYDEASAATERAIKEEPTLALAYGNRIMVSLHERKHADTLEWLKKMVEACRPEMLDLATNPVYAEFVRSPQYREWQKWYRARAKK